MLKKSKLYPKQFYILFLGVNHLILKIPEPEIPEFVPWIKVKTTDYLMRQR